MIFLILGPLGLYNAVAIIAINLHWDNFAMYGEALTSGNKTKYVIT